MAVSVPLLHHGRMVDGRTILPEWSAMTATQVDRWNAVLRCLVEMVPGDAHIVVDGAYPQRTLLAERLAEALRDVGRPCVRLGDDPATSEASVSLADGPGWRERPPAGGWDVVIWLRTPGADRAEADVVLDLIDPAWPVIRQVAKRLASSERWWLTESRAFFAAKAPTWDAKFGDELPAYAAAVGEAGLRTGGAVADVGCGTGRALPALRSAVGPTGTVIGIDLTPQMLAEASDRGRDEHASLVIGDACRLPVADGALDGVFAAGLLMHLPDPDAGLRELARVVRAGGRLVLFHPSGRAALAARHGRRLNPDEALAPAPLRRSTAATGWRLDSYDDAAHRFLAIATRSPQG
jgi:SAM-dependent methyltransferase